MPLLRAGLARVALALALLAWVATVTGSLLHPYWVAHVTCAEHGEVIELRGADDDDDVEDAVTAGDPDDGDHDHGCVVDHATPHALAWAVPAPPVPPAATLPPAPPAPVGTPIRGPPPLAYAPKTSPPLG